MLNVKDERSVMFTKEELELIKFHLRLANREYRNAISTLARARKPRVVWATNAELITERKRWSKEVEGLLEKVEGLI